MARGSANMNLKEYEQEKFGIADTHPIRAGLDTKDDSLQSECRDLLTRLAEDGSTSWL